MKISILTVMLALAITSCSTREYSLDVVYANNGTEKPGGDIAGSQYPDVVTALAGTWKSTHATTVKDTTFVFDGGALRVTDPSGTKTYSYVGDAVNAIGLGYIGYTDGFAYRSTGTSLNRVTFVNGVAQDIDIYAAEKQ
ncbi:MAG: hypothetical protein ACRCS8_05395 [Brevinema sp.]